MSMTSATVEFEVESVEQVAGGAGLALLRVCGRWRSEAAVELGPAVLVVGDGRRSRRLEAEREAREELTERLDEAVEAGIELERRLASEREAREAAQAHAAELEERLAEGTGEAQEPAVAESAAPSRARPWVGPEARRRRAVAL